jgi:hypothetical protein
MKKIIAKFGLVTLLASGSAAAAFSSTGVLLNQVELGNSGSSTTVYLGFVATPSGKPSCATKPQGVLTGTAEQVKSMTNLATAAFLAGRPVRVNWTGSCSSSNGQISALLVE